MGNTNSMGGIGSVGGDFPEEKINCKKCGKELEWNKVHICDS